MYVEIVRVNNHLMEQLVRLRNESREAILERTLKAGATPVSEDSSLTVEFLLDQNDEEYTRAIIYSRGYFAHGGVTYARPVGYFKSNCWEFGTPIVNNLLIKHISMLTHEMYAVVTPEGVPLEFFKRLERAERFIAQMIVDGDLFDSESGSLYPMYLGIRPPHQVLDSDDNLIRIYEEYKDEIVPRTEEDIRKSGYHNLNWYWKE